MLYPKNLEQKLGFDIVREQLKSYCSGSTGQSFVDKIQFSTQFDTVNKLLSQTEELRRLLASGEVLPSNNFLNIQPQLRKAEIENSYLEEPELVSLRSALETANECIRFFNSKPEGELPQLKALTGGLFLDKGIIPRINLIIDENGRIRDSASSELQKVRKQLIAEQGSLRRKIESIMRQAAANSY
ncbi:MAG: endonuclease MutS2, partial [Flexibacteraceae bacterium]